MGVVINRPKGTLTICGKTMYLNKDIFLYENEILKPGESKVVLGNTNGKDREISLQDKIADPRIAVRKRARAKNGTCKVKIYNILDKKIEIPKEIIIPELKKTITPN
jgi:hypothetical protein